MHRWFAGYSGRVDDMLYLRFDVSNRYWRYLRCTILAWEHNLRIGDRSNRVGGLGEEFGD